VPISVISRGQSVGAFRADLIVNEAVLLELKTCDVLAQEHQSQTLNYLRVTNIEVALFGPSPRFKRFVMDNDIKKPSRKSVQSVSIGVRDLEDATGVRL
jgi:PD-(D/E)XK nuclease superfamily